MIVTYVYIQVESKGMKVEFSVHYMTKSPVTQALITRMKSRMIKMYALDWLYCSTQNTPMLIQPIIGVHFYQSCFRYRACMAFSHSKVATEN